MPGRNRQYNALAWFTDVQDGSENTSKALPGAHTVAANTPFASGPLLTLGLALDVPTGVWYEEASDEAYAVLCSRATAPPKLTIWRPRMAKVVRAPRIRHSIDNRLPPIETSTHEAGLNSSGLSETMFPAFAPDAEKLNDPLKVAILRVMDEPVLYEVSPGRFAMVSQVEAYVRDLRAQAVYDRHARKELIDLYRWAVSAYKQLKAEEAEREAVARQRALREAEWQAEREADEKRRKSERRRQRKEEQKAKKAREAAQAAAEAEKLRRQAEVAAALTATVAASETSVSGAEDAADPVPVQCDQPLAEAELPYEDPRLGWRGDEDMDQWERRPPRPAPPRSREVPPPPQHWDHEARRPVELQRREVNSRRRRGEPLIKDAKPITGYGYF